MLAYLVLRCFATELARRFAFADQLFASAILYVNKNPLCAEGKTRLQLVLLHMYARYTN